VLPCVPETTICTTTKLQTVQLETSPAQVSQQHLPLTQAASAGIPRGHLQTTKNCILQGWRTQSTCCTKRSEVHQRYASPQHIATFMSVHVHNANFDRFNQSWLREQTQYSCFCRGSARVGEGVIAILACTLPFGMCHMYLFKIQRFIDASPSHLVMPQTPTRKLVAREFAQTHSSSNMPGQA